MMTGTYNVWGGTPADQCTSNAFYGCERSAAGSGKWKCEFAGVPRPDYSFEPGLVDLQRYGWHLLP